MAFIQIVNQKFDTGYRGPAEKAIYTLSIPLPDQVGARLAADRIIDANIQALADQGSELLELKVWEDRSPTWATNYRIEVIAATGEVNQGITAGIALGPLAWTLIIGTIVIILGLLVDWALVSVSQITHYAPVAVSAVGIALLIGVAGIIALGVKGGQHA